MKILLLDIETAPNVAYVWSLWKENIPLDRVVASGYVLCWAAKWYGEKEVRFDSLYQSSERTMVRRIHRLLDEADAVIHYNGKSFDIPTLNKEFVLQRLGPPRPYKQLDLLHVVRDAFRFPSNKLDYVVRALGLGQKVRHTGFEMWVKCMNKDAAAWREMEKYNRHDVVVLERLYDRLKPWIKSHPNYGVHDDKACCPNCGSESYQRRGFQTTRVMRYPRYQCCACGTWFRGSKSLPMERTDRLVNIAA